MNVHPRVTRSFGPQPDALVQNEFALVVESGPKCASHGVRWVAVVLGSWMLGCLLSSLPSCPLPLLSCLLVPSIPLPPHCSVLGVQLHHGTRCVLGMECAVVGNACAVANLSPQSELGTPQIGRASVVDRRSAMRRTERASGISEQARVKIVGVWFRSCRRLTNVWATAAGRTKLRRVNDDG